MVASLDDLPDQRLASAAALLRTLRRFLRDNGPGPVDAVCGDASAAMALWDLAAAGLVRLEPRGDGLNYVVTVGGFATAEGER